MEVYILDIYRSALLKKNDVVLDAGAGIGDFAILASKKVGADGKVIAVEPHAQDYQLLKANIKRNNCSNVIPLNLGLGSASGQQQMEFKGRSYRFEFDTLANVLKKAGTTKQVNFIKMDIEGFETEVIREGSEIIRNADCIAIELHSTKAEVDKILTDQNFDFVPITKIHMYKQIIKNLILHPALMLRSYRIMKQRNRHLLSYTMQGFEYSTNYQFLSGCYIKNSSQRGNSILRRKAL